MLNAGTQPDLAVATKTNMGTLIGNGDGSFKNPTSYTAGTTPNSIAVGDFNLDQSSDLAVSNIDSNDVSIFLNQGSGTFSKTSTLTTGLSPWTVVSADANGDQKPDLIVGNANGDSISALLGDGAGGFARTDYPTGHGLTGIAAVHLNGDPYSDVVGAAWTWSEVRVLTATSTGSYPSSKSYALVSDTYRLWPGDLNGDAFTDLVIANYTGKGLNFLLGRGDGTFSAGGSISVSVTPWAVAIGDFNGDQHNDIAYVGGGSNAAMILLNTTP